MANPILRITDGTTTVDLLARKFGYHLNDWKPAAPDIKDGGVFQSSPFVDGRRLAFRRFANAIETFDLKVNGQDQDEAIYFLQELRRLCEKAVSYWTNGWQGGPVWIEARGSNETNIRYAVVMDYRALADNNPYAQPFFSCISAVDGFTFIVERDHWRHVAPGTGECVQISNQQAWDIGEPNLVLNGDFETAGGGGADVFQNWTEITSGAATITRSGSPIYNGSFACKLHTDNAGNYSGLQQIIAVSAMSVYDFSFYAYDPVGTPDAVGAYYSVMDHTHADAPIIEGYLKNPTTTVNEWTHIFHHFTTPVGCISLLIELRGYVPDLAVEADFSYDYVVLTKEVVPIDPGRAATCNEDEVFVANKWCMAQLTHVFNYDDSVTTYSTNLLQAALPYSLFPAAPNGMDCIFFGIDMSRADSGPFNSLVFDIGTVQAGITCHWEYYKSGVGWAALSVRDNTALVGVNAFVNSGVHSAHWTQPSDWIPTSQNGVTAYWVRVIIDSVAGPTRPTQQNRQIYTVNTPHVALASTQIEGDIPALANVALRNIAYVLTTPGPVNHIYGAYISTRSVDRGADFHQFINLCDKQNVTGTTVTVGGHCSFATDMNSATGRAILYNPPGVHVSDWVAKVVLDDTIVSNYMGEFHVFCRALQNGGNAGDFALHFVLLTGSTILYTSDDKKAPIAANEQVYDFGVIDIGKLYRRNVAGIYTNDMTLYVYASNSNAAPGDLYLYDLILVPTDEFCALLSTSQNSQTYMGNAQDYILNADSLTVPGEELLAYLSRTTDDHFVADWKKVNVGPLVLQANKAQRLFVFVLTDHSSLTRSYITATYTVKVTSAQRYLSMRGDR